MVRRLGWLGWCFVVVQAAACGNSSSGPKHDAQAGEGGEGGEATSQGGAAPDAGGAGGEGDEPDPSAGDGGTPTTNGGAAGEPSSGGQAGDSGSNLPGDNTFSSDGVLEVRLTIAKAIWKNLEEHGDLETYVAASGSVGLEGGDSESFAKVGIRHKGAYSLHHCWDDFGGVRSYEDECQKLSYKLKLDEYDREGTFDGLTTINLHASSNDDSKLRELLAYDTFRRAGVDAPRAMPARLYINDVFQGLFIAIEEIDKRYLQAHFPDGSAGNLYKEVWPNPAFTDQELSAALEGNKKADVSDMRSFAATVGSTAAPYFEREVERHVSIDQVLRYLAVDRLLRNWDGITAFYSPLTPHNFYWYHESTKQGRFHLIPWDLDNTLWAFDPYMYPEQWVQTAPVPDYTMEPANCTPRVVWDPLGETFVTPPRCDKFLDLLVETQFERFTKLAAQLRKGALDPEQMQAVADHYKKLITPIVKDDPTIDQQVWKQAVSDLADILPDAAADFDAIIDAGLVEEPSQDLDSPTSDDGLHVGGITNFEFEVAPETGVPAGAVAFADPLATFEALWSQAEPLSGEADLRLDFTFNRGPKAFDEWVNLGLFTAEADASHLSSITVLLASDRPRQIRIRVASPAYDEDFGGVWQEFGVDRFISQAPSAVTIPFKELYYPKWARAEWTGDQGFKDEAAAKALVLSRLNGLIFAPAATFDEMGELSTETEAGWLRVDNIYFE